MRTGDFKKLLIRMIESAAPDRETAAAILRQILEKLTAGGGDRPKK